ncbi:MAG: hypothetical protein E2577_15775, partial [Starkeya sp.]|nr:hypothetical protein [Starkeya sp.]
MAAKTHFLRRSGGRTERTGKRLAALLTLGCASLAAAPAGAIYLNDVDAAAVGGVQNWYDSENQFSNVVAVSIDGLAHCSGTLIN